MPTTKWIIAFAGRSGSGKGTAAGHAASRLGARQHTYSDVLYETFALWGFAREQVSRPDLQELSTFMRALKGQSAMADVMARKCMDEASGCIVIDGVRRLEDVEALQRAHGDRFVLVWIETSADVRYGRLVARRLKAGEESMPREAFDAQELAEAEVRLGLVREACKTSIGNDGGPADLVRGVDELIKTLGDFGPISDA